MTPERLSILRSRAKAWRSRPVGTYDRLLAADAAESLPEALDEIERLNARISKMERCVGDAAAWLVSSDVRHEFMESVRKRWSEL